MFTREISPRRHKRVDYAPGARVGESVELLLARQLRDLMKNPIPGVSVAPDENNIMIWEVLVSWQTQLVCLLCSMRIEWLPMV